MSAATVNHAELAQSELNRASRLAIAGEGTARDLEAARVALAFAQVHATLAIALELERGMTVTAYSVQP